jgi:hypothetical protein
MNELVPLLSSQAGLIEPMLREAEFAGPWPDGPGVAYEGLRRTLDWTDSSIGPALIENVLPSEFLENAYLPAVSAADWDRAFTSAEV